MKSLRLILIFIVIVLTLSACSRYDSFSTQNASSGTDTGQLKIVTSFYPMYIFTKNIVKDIEGVSVINMTEPQSGCLHDYQLSPADMKTLDGAHILVINGAGTESFLDKIISQMPELKIVEASKGLELLTQEDDVEEHEDEIEQHEDEEHSHDHYVNPHIWVSISGAIQEVKNIGEQLAVLDPENTAKYESNTEEYIEKLEAQKQKMHNALKDIKERNIVTFHEAFPYFAKEFDLNIVSVIESEPGTEPSAGELADTIRKIKASNVKALFAEPQYSQKAAETISRETGAKVYILDPVVTGSADAEPDAYIKTMDNNLKVLLEALK